MKKPPKKHLASSTNAAQSRQRAARKPLKLSVGAPSRKRPRKPFNPILDPHEAKPGVAQEGATEVVDSSAVIATHIQTVETTAVHAPDLDPETTGGAWLDYVAGGKNHDGEKIDAVLVRDEKFVIYMQRGRIIPEGDPATLRKTEAIAALIARITALMPTNPAVVEAVNTQIARAYDLCFSGSVDESKLILLQVLERLEGSHVAMARLHYLWAGIVTSAVCWLLILACHKAGLLVGDRLIWFQAIGIGGTGGFFAVAFAQRSIPIDLSHSTLVHWTSGIARILVAMAAAVVVLLAMKGGLFMKVAENSSAGYFELFFCFLAGFSETFVQKLLTDNERSRATGAGGRIVSPEHIPAIIGGTTAVHGKPAKKTLRAQNRNT